MSVAAGPSAEEVAKWMLVGFLKCWTIDEVLIAAGVKLTKRNDQVNEYPFMPFYIRNATPVRAHIHANWPKLAERADKGFRDEAEALRAISFLARQKTKKRAQNLTNNESAELRKDAKEDRADKISGAIYAGRNDVGKSGWRTCK